MTNPAQPTTVLDGLLGVRQPTVLPLDAEALAVGGGQPAAPSVPSGPPVDIESVVVDPMNPHIGILRTWRLTGSEHWAALPEGPLFVQDPINPHLGLLPTLST